MSSLPPTVLAAAITACTALIGALVGALVTLYVKRLDKWNAAELQHSAAREAAYNKFLAAGDRAWLLRAKGAIEQDSDRSPEQDALEKAIIELGVAGLDELRQHTHDYSQAEPIIHGLYYEAFERRDLSANGFESARARLQELIRKETGLRSNLQASRRLSLRERMRARQKAKQLWRKVDRHLVMRTGPDDMDMETLIQVSDPDAFAELLRQMTQPWDELRASVSLQETRAARWRAMGLWVE